MLSGPEDKIAVAGAERFADHLRRRTGAAVLVALQSRVNPSGAKLTVEWQIASPSVQAAIEDESYSLEVNPKEARLQAKTPLGILRGLETILQCVREGPQGYSLPALHIRDQPRFAWRGLLLDCARHFIPVAELKRTLDAMAALKFNVFHWHLTDDQGFRLESRVFPMLTQAGSSGLYYKQDEIHEIVEFARERGIRVVPEFDMPGHATSWFAGCPKLASAPGPYAVERHPGLFEPAMDPTRTEVYDFLDAFLGEVAALFPDEYVHIGGDEVDPAQWRRSIAIQGFMRDHAFGDERALQAYFNRRVYQLLAKQGKKMIGWDEILQPDLPSDAVIQAWRGTGREVDTIRSGHRSILSFGYYLDQLQPASAHYLIDPLDGEAAALSTDERQKILGGEACLWTEYVSAENLDSRLWPRAAAIVERFWSPQHVRNTESMYQRLQAASRQLELLGVRPRSQRQAILQRLVERSAVGPLEVLLESLAPVRPDHRMHDPDHILHEPLNRLVDVVEPESDAARHLGQWIHDWNGHRAEIRNLLETWRDNSAAVEPALERSPLPRETRALAESVHAVSVAGLEALSYLEQQRRPARSWLAKQRELLEHAAPPRDDLVVTLVEPVRSLIAKAANRGH